MPTETTTDWSGVPIREVSSRLDPALPRLLDLYQKSFPVDEQVLISFFLEKLEQKEKGKAELFHLDALAEDHKVAGFALYEVGQEIDGIGRGGYLSYLASNPDLRGSGLGKRLYLHVRDEMFLRHNCRGLFFEIEETADALERHGPQAAYYATWRKEWYKRQGARELSGTRYLCGVNWQPALPMQVMVHPNGPLTANEALKIAHAVQDESIEVVGKLALI